jgi:hypothetical protein
MSLQIASSKSLQIASSNREINVTLPIWINSKG